MQVKNSIYHLLISFKNALRLLFNGHFSVFYSEFNKRFYSESISYGLKRDLNIPFEASPAKIKFSIRPLIEGDIKVILKVQEPDVVNPRIIASQRAFIDACIPTCYVAVTSQNEPCYMQWLVGNKHNDKIKAHFRGIFPTLKPQEALLEGAYANPEFRGLRIMPEAMTLIAEMASLINARWVITFVDVTNIPSLKGCHRSGFNPYVLRKDKWFLFSRSASFYPLPAELLEEYNLNIVDKPQINLHSSIKKEKKRPHLQP